MERDQARADLIQSYEAYCAVLDMRGISYSPTTDEQLSKMSDEDLKTLVRHARDIACTPSN